MPTQITSDVIIIIGGGIAGMVAANRAAQLGLKATVLEQGRDEKYLCNTRYTGGTFHLCMREITLDPELLRKLILETTDGFVKDDLARLLANGGARLIQDSVALDTEWVYGEHQGLSAIAIRAQEYLHIVILGDFVTIGECCTDARGSGECAHAKVQGAG